MVCYATSDTPRCQCIVRDSLGDKVYEVTLPASTPAANLLHEVAAKIKKYPEQISLLYQNISHISEITQGTQGSLEDIGLKTSHNRNNLILQELNSSGGSSTGSSVSSTSQSWEQGTPDSNAGQGYVPGEADCSGGGVLRLLPQAPPAPNPSLNNQTNKKIWRTPSTLTSTSSSSSLPLPSTSLVSVSSPNYVGLVNQAMTCYLNSLLQALYMTPEFRNALYKWQFDGEKPSKSIPFQLQKLFLNLQTSSRGAVETTELTLSFGWGTGDVWHQHDVQELCRVMFDALEQEFKNTAQADLINQLYQGKMIDYVKCLECDREKSRVDTFLDIPLPVRPYGSTIAYSSIEEAMKAFVTPEILDGNNQYHCENCSKKCNAHKGLKFSKFPYLLTLHLKRFDFDYTTMNRIKLNDKVVFPEVLELDYFFKYPTAAQIEAKCDDGSTSTADSALGDDAASTSAAPPLPPELNSPPTDHELNEDEGIEISLGGGSASSSSSSGSYSGSESCDPQPPCDPSATHESACDTHHQTSCDQQGGGGVCDSESVSDLRSPLSGSLPPDVTDQTVPEVEEEDSTVPITTNMTDSVPTTAAPEKPQAEYKYELYSIMIHSGSASGGHYYAYIKDFATDQWFCFNDQSVTRVTEEDIEKSYGGGPTRGYYSGVFSSSTNAYMLMYRLYDPQRNALPMTPEEFPPHIRALVEEMRVKEEIDRRNRVRDEETLKVKVCYQSNQTKVLVHRDDPFSEALKQAYENLQLDGIVRKEDCRLVSYSISRDSRNCSLEHCEDDTMGNVLAYLKSNNCSTDFLLETKHPKLPFPIYRPDDLCIDVCRVNVPKEEVLAVEHVQVPTGIKVHALKHHLYLLMPELLPPPPADLVLVMYHYSSRRFPPFYHLSDDQVHMTDLFDATTYNKIFVAPLTPNLAADLENGFEKSNFCRFLKKVENVVILHITLPEVTEDILERLMIPLLSDQKASENNNKQDTVSGESYPVTSMGNSSVQEEENATACAITTSDQSTSEDSSLTDSERTIIGEPPQLEGQLSSPSDSEQLSSPETNMTMEMNGDVEDYSDDMDNKMRCNRDYYIKVTPYTQNEQKMLKIVVDRSAEWSLVEKCLEPCCGVPRQYLLVTTGSGDLAKSTDTVRTLFILKHHDHLSVRLHRPLARNEFKKKLYKFLPNSPQPFQNLCEWIVVRGQTVGESKRALLKFLEKRKFANIPYNRCRLRRKNWKAVGRPLLDTDVWDEPTRNPEELLLEELDLEDPVVSNDMVPIFVRRVLPSKLTFSHFFEIVIDTTQPFNLIKQISEVSQIPVEHVVVAKSTYNFPWDLSVFSVLQELDWVQDTVTLSNPLFHLEVDESTPIILFRDAREEKKKIDVNDLDWADQNNPSTFDRYVCNSRRTERLAMQSPRKEKPLKIYLQPKNTSMPSSSNSNITSSDNTNNCYVPPPDYDI